MDARYLRRFVVLFVCAALFCSFRTGVLHGFDHTISHGAYGRMVFALGAAITDIKGDAHGYVSTAEVQQTLTNDGFTDDEKTLASFKTQFPDNFSNERLLNQAIKAALHATNGTGTLYTVTGDDLGLVNYVKLAFALFGPKVLSFYLTYFLIAFIGVAAFVFSFRRRLIPLVLLGITAAGELMLFISDLYDQSGHAIGSVTDGRFLSVLAVVPALHVLLMIRLRLPLSWPNIIALVIQTFLLVFVCSVRSSAIWMLVAISILSLYEIAISLIRHQFVATLKSLWPALLIAFSFAFYGFYLSQTLNPLYQQEKAITHHFFWHAVLMSLHYHPQWHEKYGPIYGEGDGDGLPLKIIDKYLERHPPAHPERFYAGNPPSLTYDAYEIYGRRAFLDFLESDPKFVIADFLYYKPALFVEGLREHFSSILQPRNGNFWLAVGFLFLAGAYLGLATAAERKCMIAGAALLTFGFFMASLPNLVTDIDPYVMSDAFLLSLASIGAWTIVVIAELEQALGRFWIRRERPHAAMAEPSRLS